MTLTVGIVSAAWGVQAHLPAWRLVPGVEVVGICTAHRETAESAAAEHGIAEPFWDAQEMARHPDIDIIDVGTRPSYRREMCLAALAAGKHVYGGIPFAADLSAARELREAARVAGTVTIVDAYAEHFGAFRFAEELIADNALGTVQTVTGRLELPLFSPARSSFPYNWFADPEFGASAIRNLGSHLLHLMVFLCGPVGEVTGTCKQYLRRWEFVDTDGGIDVAVPDTAVAALRFESGAIGTMTTAWAGAAAQGFHLEVAGNLGRLLVTSPMMPTGGSSLLIGAAGGSMEAVPVPERHLRAKGIDVPGELRDNARGAMALAFLRMTRAIGGGPAAGPDFASAFHVQAVIDAISRSGEGSSWQRPER